MRSILSTSLVFDLLPHPLGLSILEVLGFACFLFFDILDGGLKCCLED
jgi:hypothetical protein